MRREAFNLLMCGRLLGEGYTPDEIRRILKLGKRNKLLREVEVFAEAMERNGYSRERIIASHPVPYYGSALCAGPVGAVQIP